MEFCKEIFQSRFRCPNSLIVGMLTSIVIHAILISFLSLISTSNVNYAARTITISFEQEAAMLSGSPAQIRQPNDGQPDRKDKYAAAGRQLSRKDDHPIIQENSTLKYPIGKESDVPSAPAGETADTGKGSQAHLIRNEGMVGAGSSSGNIPVETTFGAAGAPSFVHQEMPSYPILARRLGKEGKVVLRLFIDEKGKLLNIEVLERAGYGFLEAAVEAVKKSVFAPAVRNGERVSSKAILPVRFRLKDL